VDYYPPLPAELIYQPGDTMINFPLNVPFDADGLETFTVQLVQNVVCSGMQVTNDYTFYIDQFPPLDLVTQDVNGLCQQSYVISPQVSGGAGSYGYLWSTGETTPSITVSVDTTTTFHVTVTDTCSVPAVQDSITVFIPAYAPLSVTASPDIAIPCLGTDMVSVADVSGGNGSYVYSWSNGGSVLDTTTSLEVPAGDSTYYVMTVEEGCGHMASDSVLVSTIPLPDIAMLSWDTTVFCIGDTVVLRPLGVTGGNGVYSYSWLNDTGAVVSTADTLLVGVPSDSTYTLHVIDQCGYATDSLFHTVIPHYAPFTLQLPADTTICTGDQISLQAMVDGGSGVYTLDWEGLGWNDPRFTYAGDQDKVFVVDVLDHCGEYLSDSMQVTVQHPVTEILISNQGEDDWLFQATTVPYSVPVMIWDLGDGTVVKSTSTTHSYLDLEDHWVTLHTVSEEGCPAEDSLLVQAPATLYFPNAFTPDGDGFNDTFGPAGVSIERFSMEVFDRWGHLVYSTTDMDRPWDGRVNGGTDATTGVYVYHYSAKGHYFEEREGYGHVTLVRGSLGVR
jgi:gliding motility-associated-like protein